MRTQFHTAVERACNKNSFEEDMLAIDAYERRVKVAFERAKSGFRQKGRAEEDFRRMKADLKRMLRG